MVYVFRRLTQNGEKILDSSIIGVVIAGNRKTAEDIFYFQPRNHPAKLLQPSEWDLENNAVKYIKVDEVKAKNGIMVV